MSLLTRPRAILATVLVAGTAAVGAYAFTASNTVPSSNAGSGSGTVSGYTVSDIAYVLNGTDPTTVDKITFTLAPTDATTVKLQTKTGGTWQACTVSSGDATCAYSPAVALSDISQLTVVATDS